jgi:peptidoglycan/xylan/chitin deacetylase (PgdA/CDA1 family)
MNKRQVFARAFRASGAATLLHQVAGADHLTVLAYHRIIDLHEPDFDAFEPNVSASPEMFQAQMAFVEQHYTVISLQQLQAYVTRGVPLPPYPLLITFDDGYLDNYQNALPVLKCFGFPAVIFLMTHRMTHINLPPWWDEAAYYLHHTPKSWADLPLIGHTSLSGTSAQRIEVRKCFVQALKSLPLDGRRMILDQLPDLLDVPPHPQDRPMFVSWEQVNELVSAGIACQAHTVNHPILTEISLDEVRQELQQSRDMIEAHTSQTVYAFAYPNGQPQDYNQQIITILAETGYQIAFTLSPGNLSLNKVRRTPLEISRVFLGYKDNLDTFVLKLSGLKAIS